MLPIQFPKKPENTVLYQHHYKWLKPVKLGEWQWSSTFNRWSRVVTFKDGWEVCTYPCPPDTEKILLNLRNIWFWEYINGAFVKIKLRPGQHIEYITGAETTKATLRNGIAGPSTTKIARSSMNTSTMDKIAMVVSSEAAVWSAL